MVWTIRSTRTVDPSSRATHATRLEGLDRPADVDALDPAQREGPRTIALVNDKGGCGKTTTAVNLAGALSVRGARTLVVDATPSAHATLALGIRPESIARNLYDVLVAPDSEALLENTIRHAHPRVDVVPGGRALGALEARIPRDNADHRSERLARALDAVVGRYDYVFIDCPPNLGVLTFAALRAADEVIVPVEASSFALYGLERLLETIEILARRVDQLQTVRILTTLFDGRTRFARRMLAALRERHGDRCFDTVIRATVRLREAGLQGVPVCLHSPSSPAAEDHAALEAEVTLVRPESERARHASGAIGLGMPGAFGAALRD